MSLGDLISHIVGRGSRHEFRNHASRNNQSEFTATLKFHAQKRATASLVRCVYTFERSDVEGVGSKGAGSLLKRSFIFIAATRH
jgi:hypothetical protein